jgi:hypothetical protein
LAEGWIKLYRSILTNEYWLEKPFTRGQAWVDMILTANHENRKVPFDGNLIEVERGSYITSIRKICERWGWSNTKVVKFFKVLEEEKMIAYKSDNKKTLITILKYSEYQDNNITETSQKHHRNDTETTQKHTNKNDKNVKNDKNNISNIFVPPTLEEIQAYCKERNNGVDAQRWYDFYLSKGWMVGKNKMKDWKAAVRTWEKGGAQSGANKQPNGENTKTYKWDKTKFLAPGTF